MQRRSRSSLVAPPVVPPPLPDELSSARPHDGRGESPRRHVLRDLSIGTLCLLVGLLIGRVGWLSADGSETGRIELSTERPQLAQLTDVSLSSQPSHAVLARRDRVTADADESVAEVASPVESLRMLESAAESDLADAPAGGQAPQSSIAQVSPPEQEAVDSTPQGNDRTAGDRTEQSGENLAELLWGLPRSSQPESLLQWESPSSLLHAVEHETCAESPMSALGTALNWADKPEDAYRIAAEQHKLVFLIHVSGNFEIPGYT